MGKKGGKHAEAAAKGNKRPGPSEPADMPPISEANLQVLQVLNEAGDHTPSILLKIEDVLICFNAAEGFQRCCADAQV